ncbi:MAG: AMP-binding protein [Candidatus Binatia bacterium]
MTEDSKGLCDASAKGMDVARVAANHPNRVAIISEGYGQRTFSELNRRANQLVRALRARGVREGDHIALLCANRPEFAEVVAAVNRCGLILSPVNWHLSADEIAYVVADCGAKAFIAETRFAEAATLVTRCSDRAAVRLAVGAGIGGFESYDAALSIHPGDDIEDPCVGGFMFYTSGTTGRPKGVRQLAEAEKSGVWYQLLAAVYDFRSDAHDAVLSTGPLYHGGPLHFCVNVPLVCGIPVVLMQHWNPEGMLQLIERHRITHAYCVPTMFRRLLALPRETRRKYDVSSLRFIIHGAAPTPVADKLAMIEWLGPILTEIYGATEGVATMISSEEWIRKIGAVGRPPPDMVRILGEDHYPVPTGDVGTIYMKPYGRFEYFNAPEKTAGCFHDEFVTVGDLGRLDEDGYLYLTGRSAELIISGGTNIYPAEIDHVLLAHPAVHDAAAIGVPSAEWGEEVKAIVVLTSGVQATSDLEHELTAHCKARLGTFRTPRSVEFVAELPRSEAGKLLRRKLRDQYWGSGG